MAAFHSSIIIIIIIKVSLSYSKMMKFTKNKNKCNKKAKNTIQKCMYEQKAAQKSNTIK